MDYSFQFCVCMCCICVHIYVLACVDKGWQWKCFYQLLFTFWMCSPLFGSVASFIRFSHLSLWKGVSEPETYWLGQIGCPVIFLSLPSSPRITSAYYCTWLLPCLIFWDKVSLCGSGHLKVCTATAWLLYFIITIPRLSFGEVRLSQAETADWLVHCIFLWVGTTHPS